MNYWIIDTQSWIVGSINVIIEVIKLVASYLAVVVVVLNGEFGILRDSLEILMDSVCRTAYYATVECGGIRRPWLDSSGLMFHLVSLGHLEVIRLLPSGAPSAIVTHRFDLFLLIIPTNEKSAYAQNVW